MKQYILPNGKVFAHWEDQTAYQRTLHVSQKQGTLDGDGSEAKPFLTIAQAVPFATPGTKVVIHEGVYRETVRPLFSGKSPEEMVMFCGAEGEQVEITGAEIFHGDFKESEGWKKQESTIQDEWEFTQKDAKVYMAKFDRNAFVGVNPFSMANGPLIPWYGFTIGKLYHAKHTRSQRTTTLRRGMLFCDGKRMEQVINYYQLGEQDNRFYVEDDGLTFHIRFPNDSDPEAHVLEFTPREQCFCPEEKYFSYMHLKNLTFTKGGTGFPPPQRGVLSTNCGHHWLIENCRVLHANGVGADVGFQCPNRYSLEPRGGHIIRGSEFSYCGIVGLTGTVGNREVHYLHAQQEDILVEGCRFIDNCWHDFEEMWENSALKLHHLNNSVFAHNFISGTEYGCGIWADAHNTNLLIQGNVVLHTKHQYGSIFVEASKDDVLVCHNIVVDTKKNIDPREKLDEGGNGIYTQTCEDIKTVRNILLGCENNGIVHHYVEPFCGGGSGQSARLFTICQNIISDCAHWITLPEEHNTVDENVYGTSREFAPLRMLLPVSWHDLKHWQKNFAFDQKGRQEEISYLLEEDQRLVLTIGDEVYTFDLTADIVPQIDRIFA